MVCRRSQAAYALVPHIHGGVGLDVFFAQHRALAGGTSGRCFGGYNFYIFAAMAVLVLLVCTFPVGLVRGVDGVAAAMMTLPVVSAPLEPLCSAWIAKQRSVFHTALDEYQRNLILGALGLLNQRFETRAQFCTQQLCLL